MNAVRRLFDFFRDSPTYGRDRATLISGFSIGTAGLILNGAVLMLMLPLLLDPDDGDIRPLTENLEFGQLLALILLGGATSFATVLIPLRLLTVFWGPRIGKYFDQIVLSGISPLRFVVGKAASQNLFLGLTLFLLLPYLILSLALGGLRIEFFLAGLLLVWLYCMALALVTLWASLHLNELLAAVLVIAGAGTLAGLGCIPLPVQPFVMTPFPALLQPVFASIPTLRDRVPADFFPVFGACALCLASIIGAALGAIHLGPLYGIIRENSTFGEVVRAGDSKRKRWIRLRLHIQRPSELAFFYENRDRAGLRNEGLVRWGLGTAGMLLLSGAAYLVFVHLMSLQLAWARGRMWFAYEFHLTNLMLHGAGLALGLLLFSHARNSTYLRVSFCLGRKAEVARLDTAAFLLLALFSTAAALAAPFWFEQFRAAPASETIFPAQMYLTQGPAVDYARIAVEGTAMISVAALALYALHRLVCLLMWMRTAAFLASAIVYFVAVCLLPLFTGALFAEIPQLRQFTLLTRGAASLAMVSPLTVIMSLFAELGSQFPRNISTVPFYVFHLLLIALAVFTTARRGRALRLLYPAEPAPETHA